MAHRRVPKLLTRPLKHMVLATALIACAVFAAAAAAALAPPTQSVIFEGPSRRAHPPHALDAALRCRQPRPRAGLAHRPLRRHDGQPAQRRQPEPLQRARGRAQLRRLGGLVCDALSGSRRGGLRAGLPVGELQGHRVGGRAPARLAQGLLPAVRTPGARSPRACTRWWCASTGEIPRSSPRRGFTAPGSTGGDSTAR